MYLANAGSPVPPSRRRGGAARLAAVAALLIAQWLVSMPAAAQGLESVLAPGKLAQAHAKLEEDCQKCHVKFDRNAQDRLCMDCHKDVGQDMRGKTGFHGRMKPQACKTCHSDHKGRGARIVSLDTATFDHAVSNFALRGGHAMVKCEKCHLPGKGFRIAARDCVACHRKDDPHKGSLGPKCADCHAEASWKDAKFDHSMTRFPLTGKHEAVKCADCHKDTRYKETPQTCLACHRKDDKHKTRFGEKCETCHGTKDWKGIRFNHDTETHYPLLGKHRMVTCQSCHTGFLYRDKLPSKCVDCHQKDDKHKGTLGESCESCHNERSWKTTSFDHAKTAFPLLGKHQKAECAACHKSTNYKEAAKECFSCHQKDDKHQGQEGKACAQCHDEMGWKPAPKFDHGLARFPLLGKHVPVECKLCHASALFKSAKSDCVACHAKDDKHKKTLGPACEQCHNARSWKTWDFDHDTRTKFVLDGKHKGLACSTCHTRPVEGRVSTSSQCVSCHVKDDVHEGSYGRQCQQCHVTDSFKNIKSRFGRPMSLVGPARRLASAASLRGSTSSRRLPS